MKYKKGQRVKIGGTYPKGSIGEDKDRIFTIESIYSITQKTYWIERPGEWKEEWLEPVEEVTFKIGQKFKVLDNLPRVITAYKIGDILVYEKEGGTYNGKPTYDFEGDLWGYVENFEPIEQDDHEEHMKLYAEHLTKKGGENEMTHEEYHIGDKYELLPGSCFRGEYTITEINSAGTPIIRIPGNYCSCTVNWRFISCVKESMGSVITLSKAQKQAWDKDQQALYRVGLVDANGEFIGSDTVSKATARVNRSALVAQAEADIKEAEDEAKKAEKVK